MPIYPLPQFEADVKEIEEDRRVYERLSAPKSMVVRYGSMKMVGEFPYDGQAKPGCGSKLVVRTQRGTEIGEMLTSTCPNAGCSKSVTRKQMLQYIENSGGRDYPFTTDGRVLRVATAEDMERQARLEQSRHGLKLEARRVVEGLGLPMKIVDAEPILGGERLTFYFASEQRIDFRELVRLLGVEHQTRVEMRQVGARDEARLTADYERCGQHCCCKNFLKVLKPISMRSAKVQKATLDPLKISGRCGRLMCCLRYEDQTYEELRQRLPRRKQRVGTPEGDGFVVDTQILTQLALVQLEAEDRQVAVPVEDLTEPAGAAAGERTGKIEPSRPGRRGETPDRRAHAGHPRPASPPTPAPPSAPPSTPPSTPQSAPESVEGAGDAAGDPAPQGEGDEGGRRRRRRRRKRRGGQGPAPPG